MARARCISAPTAWRSRPSPSGSATWRRTTGRCSRRRWRPLLQQGPARSSARSITTALSGAVVGKGNHRHFMMKEICEQPAVIGETLAVADQPAHAQTELGNLPIDFADIDRLSIVACGTAYYAGVVGKYWFEKLARLPVEVDIASEFRYRAAPLAKDRRHARDLPVGRDGGYPRRAALCQEPGPQGAGGPERAREHHGAGIRPCAADPRGPGDRRRLDQGLHHPAYGAGLPGAGRRPGPGRDRCRPGGGADPGAAGSAGPGERDPGRRKPRSSRGGRDRRGARRAVPRPRARPTPSRWKAR